MDAARVLVNQPGDPSQEAMLFEIFEVLMQIKIRHTVILSPFLKQSESIIGSIPTRQPDWSVATGGYLPYLFAS
jgi:hypothetical protein